jgi:Ca2+-binding RTX toxin-like protein
VTVAGRATVSGGDGDDVISTGDGPEPSGVGFDSISPGPGDDTVSAGGGGTDEISYEGVAGDRTIDLGAGRMTARSSEVDRIDGVESALGGRGDDVIIGTAQANFLSGGPGRNRLQGAGGPDTLVGGPGNDVLRGGGGNDKVLGYEGDDVEDGGAGADQIADADDSGRDRLLGGPGRDTVVAESDSRTPDTVSCGKSRDRVANTDLRDRVARDCERLVHAGLPMAPVPRRLGRNTLAFRFACPQRRRCRAAVSVLGRHGRLLARRRFSIIGRRSRSVRLRPPAGTLRRGTVLSMVVRRRGWAPDGHRFAVP